MFFKARKEKKKTRWGAASGFKKEVVGKEIQKIVRLQWEKQKKEERKKVVLKSFFNR